MIVMSISRIVHGSEKVCLSEQIIIAGQVIQLELSLVMTAIEDADRYSVRYGAPSKKLLERSLSYLLCTKKEHNGEVIKYSTMSVPELLKHKQRLSNSIDQQVRLSEAHYD